MSADLQGVVISKTNDGRWLAHHVPSGRKIEGDSMESVQASMREALGLNQQGKFEELSLIHI